MIQPDPDRLSTAWTRTLAVGYERVARPGLFTADPEVIHERMITTLERTPAVVNRALRAAVAGERCPVEVAGIAFDGRVGLAAGLDKDGRAAASWAGFGFGFAELGTVTPVAQPGNDRPRLFRLPESKAIINRMGFNNSGSPALASRLRRRGVRRGNRALGLPLGVSIGKNKVTPNERATDDYRAALADVVDVADYVAINVSSPNTPGLRSLQAGRDLEALVSAVVQAAGQHDPLHPVPIFVKVAPDLEPDDLAVSVRAAEVGGAAALIATNTTLARDGVAEADRAVTAEAGGLSGAPLSTRALQVVERVVGLTDLPVVGVGGLMTADDTRRMFAAGATLVQVYTGFIYSGPALVRAANRVSREANA
ncbi:quinone-dependent dihydroorotate dehydrogenase [Aestuariimicrobium soli]|uniref:quinone-dependent dihydroorotate dehydrogenase n=1 Tax=Aestuariimicrobium soli TaxID=2035834 RepID=UPI003EB94FF6